MRGGGVRPRKEYTIKVEQIIIVEAETYDEALRLLPEYPYSPNPMWKMYQETILLMEVENA